MTLTPDRGAYLEEQVALSADDYYSGRGESPGRWFGAAAATLGLAGVVGEGGLERLIEGRHPLTGEQLRRAIAVRTIQVPSLDPETGGRIGVEQRLDPVGGFDFVFSAPKSISLAVALSGPEVGRQIAAAHQAAVAATLRLLEREACGVRLGAGGSLRLSGSGVVAALYTHRTSRDRDPQLHTHCAIGNLTQGPDGRWRALDSRRLLREWKLTLGYAYQSELRSQITRRLGWRWREPARGLAELEPWPAEALREFSQRRQRIEEALADHGGSSWQAGQVAALATRPPKTTVAVGVAQTLEGWRARLGEHGMSRAQLAHALAPSRLASPPPTPDELVAVAERLAGPEGLTEKANTFRRADVVRAWAGARPAGIPIAHLESLADWYLAQPRYAVALDDGRFTTPGLLACEKKLLALVADGRDSQTAILPPRLVEDAVERSPVRLSGEQERVVCALTRSGHAIENLEALAGTGKTTVCGVLAAAYHAGGYQVIGATPTARAARELSDAGVEADTIGAILTRLEHRPTHAPRRLVVLADESGMAGTRQMAELASWVHSGGGKIIQVGDSHQLSGVPASGAFAAITQRHGAERLTEVRRQRDGEEIAALAELRAGRPERYLAHQLKHRRLLVAADPTTATNEASAWWLRAAQTHGIRRVALITRTNDLRDDLNTTIRRLRTLRGELGGPIIDAADRSFQRGDRIICRHNDRTLKVDNGTRATILTVDPASRRLDIQTDDGRRIRLSSGYLDDGHVEHAYALTAHSLQGATLEAACIVSRPDDHTTRWTYTAASRARHATSHIVIDDPQPTHERPGPDLVARLLNTMSRDTDDDLATEHLPPESASHHPTSTREQISHRRRERGRAPSLER